jgi:hypothetical protein
MEDLQSYEIRVYRKIVGYCHMHCTGNSRRALAGLTTCSPSILFS